MDVRMAENILFFIIFAVVSGATSNKDQKQGVDFGRAVSIIFMLNEIDQLVYYQTKIESIGQDRDKNDINHRIEFINSFFPNLWCVFERIVVERIFYFFIYNASCAIAEVFRNDQNE